jgi:hypothetical protein
MAIAQPPSVRVSGYITLEKNIVGLPLDRIEAVLGLPTGLLTNHGARIAILKRHPSVGEFAFAGSTMYPGGDGLVGLERRRNVPVPHAWQGQRLVKVMPVGPRSADDIYPRVKRGQVEQWVLLVQVDAEEVCALAMGQHYWPRR